MRWLQGQLSPDEVVTVENWCFCYIKVTQEEVLDVQFKATKVCLQVCGGVQFSQLVLSLWSTLFLQPFKVQLMEFTCDGRQRLSFGLGQEQADIQGRQQADGSERHKAEFTQLPLEKGANTKLSDECNIKYKQPERCLQLTNPVCSKIPYDRKTIFSLT